MSGYWMVRATTASDEEAAKEYAKLWKSIGEKYSAKILASAGECETVEGSARPRNLIIEFPSYQAALDCYYDPAYKEAMVFVNRAFVRDLVIVQGNDEI